MGRTTGTATPGGTPALVVVAHGSRDPRALSTVRALLDRVRALRPALPVHLGHIELNAPLLPGTLAALGHREAVLVPLLLSRGHHVKRDIPETAAASPARTRVAAPLGPHPLLVDVLHDNLLEAGWPSTPPGTPPSSSPPRAPATRTPGPTRTVRRRSWPPASVSRWSRRTPRRRPRRSRRPCAR